VYASFMDVSVTQQIEDIRAKVIKLKARMQRLEQENDELRASVFEYLQQLDAFKKDQQKAEKVQQHAEISRAITLDKKQLQKELDKYILMIDKCIASVNSKM
jgi:predicted RNase H-like nuclease (RuvC/YqgF family)